MPRVFIVGFALGLGYQYIISTYTLDELDDKAAYLRLLGGWQRTRSFDENDDGFSEGMGKAEKYHDQ